MRPARAATTGSALDVVPGLGSDARLRALAWTVCWLSVLCLLTHVGVLAVQRPTAQPQPWWYGVTAALSVVGVPVLGAFIVARSPRTSYGWVWLGLGATVGTIEGVAALSRLQSGVSSPGWLGGLLVGWLFVWALVCIVMVLLLFPDSRLPSPRWRWVSRGAMWTAAVTSAALPFAPAPQSGSPSTPVAAAGTLGPVLAGIVETGLAALFGLIVVSTAAVPLRWRRADATQRRQLKWFALGAAWFAPAFVLVAILDDALPAYVNAALNFSLFVALELAVGTAILRHGLFDVDRVINRTLLYSALSACLVTTYLGVVVVSSVLLADHLPSAPQALATAAVALLVLPVRARVQKAVNRLTFGSREDPYEVVADLAGHLQTAGDPEAVLSGIVESVAVTLRLPFVAITLRRGDDVIPGAVHGRAPTAPVGFPLTHQGEHVGVLLASARSAREDLTASDRRLLADLARHAGAAAHAFLLADDLRRSRSRVLAAREEERRRLRRDLHDGLGPTLAAVALGLGTASRRLDEPERAARMLARLSTDLQGAIDEVRRLAHGLRPPALDQFGLVEAIRADARRFESEAVASSAGLSIHVDAPAITPPLPAAVEVAAYRIVGEALTNVVRHSSALHCVVRLAFDDEFRIEILDDGLGVNPDHRRGVGLCSMVERAAEVGGHCEIDRVDPHGTQVHAHLPLEAVT